MSSLFGQVWLWSLLSFVAGVALTWLVLVRPAKRELEDLEERLLTSPRPTSTSGGSATSRSGSSDEFDDWHVEASRSLADDVLTPEPARPDATPERARLETPAPEAVRYDVTNMKLDQRDSLLEELDDEHRPLSDFEEQHDFPEFDAEPPRSLFDRLAPGQTGPAPDGRETPEPAPRPRPRQPEDEPELPAEATTVMPAVPAGPVAEVAPRRDEPTAPPEVEVFQPREVWREEPVGEVYDEDVDTAGHEEEDEPERTSAPAAETTLIPATALAEAIAEVDGEQRRSEAPEAQVWPEHDLTGHFAPVDVESAHGELSEPVRPTASDEAFLDELTRERESRQSRSEHDEQARDEPAGDDRDHEEGPRTDVIRAVVDTEPSHARPEAEPEPTPEPRAARAPEPEPSGAELVAEPEVAPEPVDPPAFEPTFVPSSSDRPLPARTAEPKPATPEPKTGEPARPRSLFEPLPDSDEEPEPEQTRPAPASAGNDQPFVPTLAPELLAGNPVPMHPTGLPQRPTRPAAQRTPPPAPPAPKPITPPPPRPVRPRPVGFSPSTGGRQPSPGSTRFQGQQEGFNPRSPFGPGSVLPKSDGLAPAPEFQVKATLTGRRYFTNDSANFRETRADVWFRTTADAEKAGFRQAP
ncbi:hypothetical protein ACFXGA_13390 [Actinosynnema sp. NPDC059335]|uniref:sunset domain-containing protein n=1 Tax=Actinosynnema sp. NPDC059335 TaxID=3346804 RepID=UPI0036725587